MSRVFLKPNDTSAPLGLLGVENDNDVVVVSALRPAIGKARRGGFAETTPDERSKLLRPNRKREAGARVRAPPDLASLADRTTAELLLLEAARTEQLDCRRRRRDA